MFISSVMCINLTSNAHIKPITINCLYSAIGKHVHHQEDRDPLCNHCQWLNQWLHGGLVRERSGKRVTLENNKTISLTDGCTVDGLEEGIIVDDGTPNHQSSQNDRLESCTGQVLGDIFVVGASRLEYGTL